MGIIKEPINVDFIVDSRPLTENEKIEISNFIRKDKEKIKKNKKKSEKSI